MQRRWLHLTLTALAFALVIVLVSVFGLRHPSQQAIAEKTAPASEPSRKPDSPTPAVKPSPLKLKVTVTKSGETITFGELIDRLATEDFVCVGEQHDSELNHRVQLQIIQALFARDENIGVGMETFQKPFQPVIDRYFSGGITEEQFLKDTEYKTRWGFDWKLYRPIIEFARRNEIPLAALNVRKELTSRLYKGGYDALTADEKKELGPIDFNVKAHRDYWYERLPKLHGLDNPTAQQKERSYQIMTAWDDYMAQSAARFKKDISLHHMVILAGIGHIAGGFGIPDRAAKYAGSASVATIRVRVSGSNAGEENEEGGNLPTDYVVTVEK